METDDDDLPKPGQRTSVGRGLLLEKSPPVRCSIERGNVPSSKWTAGLRHQEIMNSKIEVNINSIREAKDGDVVVAIQRDDPNIELLKTRISCKIGQDKVSGGRKKKKWMYFTLWTLMS